MHPRIGVADVVPIVPIRPADAERARAAALELGRRIGTELGLAVFLYADLAPGRGPAFFQAQEGRTGCRRGSTPASSSPTSAHTASTRARVA